MDINIFVFGNVDMPAGLVLGFRNSLCVRLGVYMAGRGSTVISVSHTPAVFMVPVRNPGSVSVTPTGEDSFVTKVVQFP